MSGEPTSVPTPSRRLSVVASARTPAGPQLLIDPTAIAANTRSIAATCGAELMAVVKADGYGHGSALMARTALANGATWAGVTSVAEALQLRRDGVTAPVLSWLNPVDTDYQEALVRDVQLAIPSLGHLTSVLAAGDACAVRARVHLHADCGMARDGASPRDWQWLCARAADAQRRGLLEVVGIMGHLGCADDPDDPCTVGELDRFRWATRTALRLGLRPAHRHLGGTSAALLGPSALRTMCRVGAGLVGLSDRPDSPGGARPDGETGPHLAPVGRSVGSATGPAFRPAMTLTAPIVSVRDVPAGTAVGYGAQWRTTRRTTLALVPLGYADGIPRAGGPHGQVQLREHRCPVVGRVSMDQTVIDIGSLGARAGDQVTVFGPGDNGEPTVADWARWSGTIGHEIVTGIGARVTRRVAPDREQRTTTTPRDPGASRAPRAPGAPR